MAPGLSAAGNDGYFDDYCFYTGPATFPILPPPPPRLVSPLEAGDGTVTVENIVENASMVTVYANDISIGDIDPAGADTIDVPVTALTHLDEITAVQTVGGDAGVPSTSLEVGIGNGDLYLSIGIRETGDTGPLGTPGGTSGEIEWIGTTEAVDGAPHGMAVSPNGGLANDPV